MSNFTPYNLSISPEALLGCLRDREPVHRLGESPEENEYLRQLEEVYHNSGATNLDQADFFLRLLRRIEELEKEPTKPGIVDAVFKRRISMLEKDVRLLISSILLGERS
jgi:hypothetical protein